MDNKQGSIIQAVEQCLRRDGCSRCEKCPYTHVGDGFECREKLRDDIIALLKAQEPRVLSLEEMRALNQYAIVWYENINTEGALPRIVNYVSDYGVHFTDGAIWRFDADRYGSVWRCWTSRPTDAQREATPWQDN